MKSTKQMYQPIEKLELGNIVIFHYEGKNYEYIFNGAFMGCPNYGNGTILHLVYGSEKNYIQALTELYGYPPERGGWPEAYGENYEEDVIRVVNDILSKTGQLINPDKEYQEGELTPEVQTYDIW